MKILDLKLELFSRLENYIKKCFIYLYIRNSIDKLLYKLLYKLITSSGVYIFKKQFKFYLNL